MKITEDMSIGAYHIVKKVYNGNLSRTEGKVEIAKNTGMSEGSALAFITIFIAMMNGETYKRAFNNYTNRFLLENIEKDFGLGALKVALRAVQGHIDYYGTLGKGNLIGLQGIVNEMKENLV